LITAQHGWDAELAAAVEAARTQPKAWLPAGLYDTLKWCTLIGLPATATLYSALAAVWSWDMAGEVAMSVTAICTFLGVLLGLSKADYKAKDADIDGTVHLGGADAQLSLDAPASPGDKVTLKVL